MLFGLIFFRQNETSCYLLGQNIKLYKMLTSRWKDFFHLSYLCKSAKNFKDKGFPNDFLYFLRGRTTKFNIFGKIYQEIEIK